MKDDDLPDALRPMNPAQRQAEIDKQMTERKSLNDAHVGAGEEARRVRRRAAQEGSRRSTADSFDRVVEETLRAQIKR